MRPQLIRRHNHIGTQPSQPTVLIASKHGRVDFFSPGVKQDA